MPRAAVYVVGARSVAVIVEAVSALNLVAAGAEYVHVEESVQSSVGQNCASALVHEARMRICLQVDRSRPSDGAGTFTAWKASRYVGREVYHSSGSIMLQEEVGASIAYTN